MAPGKQLRIAVMSAKPFRRSAGALTLLLSLAAGAAYAAARKESHAPAAAHKAAPAAAAPAPHDDHGEPSAAATPAAGHDVHWGYEGVDGPVHWGHLSPDYALCSAGRMQSPVDLGFANVRADLVVSADYKRGPLTILNNGHTVQVNFPEGSSLTSSGRRFSLVQVHFHTPSENSLNGKIYPMEAHFVHRDASGQLAVLGVFFEEGPTNVELAKIVVAAPNQAGGPKTIEGFDFEPKFLLPADLRVFRLMGSLTTPPCTEGVNWHVAKTVMTASANQIAAMAKLMGNNARPIQPLNNRLMIAPN
jgi:carbonic anhydrase